MSEMTIGLGAMNSAARQLFLRSLQDLTLETGLTPERFEGSEALGFMRKYFGIRTVEEGYMMLHAALDAMDSSQLHVQALLSSYGSKDLAGNLRDRRWDFANKHEIADLQVVKLESQAINELAQKLDALARGEVAAPTYAPSVQELLIALLANGQEIKELLITISRQLNSR